MGVLEIYFGLQIFLSFLLGIVIFMLAFVTHELGHWIVLQKYNPPEMRIKFWRIGTKVFCGHPENYATLTDGQHKLVLIAGPVMGMPIIGLAFMVDPFAAFIALAGYLAGSWADLKGFVEK